MVNELDIIGRQLGFFQTLCTGCTFAAAAASNPKYYGWHHYVTEPKINNIEEHIEESISNRDVTTLSLLFPEVTNITQMLDLILEMQRSHYFSQDLNFGANGHLCIGIRLRIAQFKSWVLGFGPMSYLPATRRAPYTEIIVRVKLRPHYKWSMKLPSPDSIHLADLDMKGITKEAFVRLWDGSVTNTKRILGSTRDMRSKAKTTFSFPEELVYADHRYKSFFEDSP